MSNPSINPLGSILRRLLELYTSLPLEHLLFWSRPPSSLPWIIATTSYWGFRLLLLPLTIHPIPTARVIPFKHTPDPANAASWNPPVTPYLTREKATVLQVPLRALAICLLQLLWPHLFPRSPLHPLCPSSWPPCWSSETPDALPLLLCTLLPLCTNDPLSGALLPHIYLHR